MDVVTPLMRHPRLLALYKAEHDLFLEQLGRAYVAEGENLRSLFKRNSRQRLKNMAALREAAEGMCRNAGIPVQPRVVVAHGSFSLHMDGH